MKGSINGPVGAVIIAVVVIVIGVVAWKMFAPKENAPPTADQSKQYYQKSSGQGSNDVNKMKMMHPRGMPAGMGGMMGGGRR